MKINIRCRTKENLDAFNKEFKLSITPMVTEYNFSTGKYKERKRPKSVKQGDSDLNKFYSSYFLGQPEFIQEDEVFYHEFVIKFNSEDEKNTFMLEMAQEIADRYSEGDDSPGKVNRYTKKTKTIFFPYKKTGSRSHLIWTSDDRIQPNYPVYVISKGRWKTPMTIKALIECGIQKLYVVVEEQELENYKTHVPDPQIEYLVLPMEYKYKYEYLDDKGLTFSSGSGPARNFVWDHSISLGFDYHWIMDDNIDGFYRLHRNTRIWTKTINFLRASEDLFTRFENLGIAGIQYGMFAAANMKHPPIRLNKRIYSCLFIKNDIPFRWRGRFNEDTILSIDCMKAGLCTIHNYQFPCNKIATQRVKGGNTDTIYKDGTYEKSDMLVRTHPDISSHMHRFGRDHHYVDYSGFTYIEPKYKKGIDIDSIPKVNDYGIYLWDTIKQERADDTILPQVK